MGIVITISVSTDDVDRFLSEFKTIIFGVMEMTVERIIAKHQRIIAESLRSTDGLPGSPPRSRSNDLLRSMRKAVSGQTIETLQGLSTVGVGIPYSIAQEVGAVIKAKNAKYLAFPTRLGTPKNYTARGPRFHTVGELEATTGTNKVMSIFNRRVWLYSRQKGTKQFNINSPDPYFYLRKQVTLPARPFFYPAWRGSEMKSFLTEEITKAGQRLVKRAGGKS